MNLGLLSFKVEPGFFSRFETTSFETVKSDQVHTGNFFQVQICVHVPKTFPGSNPVLDSAKPGFQTWKNVWFQTWISNGSYKPGKIIGLTKPELFLVLKQT